MNNYDTQNMNILINRNFIIVENDIYFLTSVKYY